MGEVFVAASADLGESQRRVVNYGAQEIGIVRIGGQVHAFLNVCPHQGGPVCQGLLIRKVEEIIDPDKRYIGMKFSDELINIVCPWHGWEFDIATGRCSGDGKQSLRKFEVREAEGKVYVLIG